MAEWVIARAVYEDVLSGLDVEPAGAFGGFAWDKAAVVVANKCVVGAALSY